MASHLIFHGHYAIGDCDIPRPTEFRFTYLDGTKLTRSSTVNCYFFDAQDLGTHTLYAELRPAGTETWSDPIGPSMFYVSEPSASLSLIAGLVGLAVIGRIRHAQD